MLCNAGWQKGIQPKKILNSFSHIRPLTDPALAAVHYLAKLHIKHISKTAVERT